MYMYVVVEVNLLKTLKFVLLQYAAILGERARKRRGRLRRTRLLAGDGIGRSLPLRQEGSEILLL